MSELRILRWKNLDLQRDLEALINLLAGARPIPEIEPYQERVLRRCRELSQEVRLNIAYLDLRKDQIVAEVLSRTLQFAQEARLISAMWAIPILRGGPPDRLCLKTIQWLHQSHPRTAAYPAAVMNGNCAIRPSLHIAPLYLFPVIEQRGLRHQPLLFHEFGHFLYRCHGPEMDDLVRDLQYATDELLTPLSQRNDRYAAATAVGRQVIADTWYAWGQELFCDAVGFAIGGPSYLHAFSHFLGLRDRGDYYRERRDLEHSTHPVTWLRVRLLARRAALAGFADVANGMEAEWRAVARLLGIQEDYHGFYDESMGEVVFRTIDDMLTETSPRLFSATDAIDVNWSPTHDSPVRLFSWAWRVYLKDPQYYGAWETERIREYLGDSVVA